MNEYKVATASDKKSIWTKIKQWLGKLSRQYEEKSEKRYVENMLSSKTRGSYSKF